MSNLHEVLGQARERAGYSQDDVGAALGVSRVMISYWEVGFAEPQRPPAERPGTPLRSTAIGSRCRS